MKFWKRSREPELEAELRANRPEARESFVANLAGQIEQAGRPGRVRVTPRLAVVGGLATAMLVAAGSLGGFGYAATAAKHIVKGVESILVAKAGEGIESNLTSGGDQYKPGFEWGDPSHTHSGPPGLTRKGGEFAPPLTTSCSKAPAHLAFKLVLDEQADLSLSVVGKHGKKLPFLKANGKTTKKLTYRVLVPRVVRVSLDIPCDLLHAGEIYLVHLGATDPSGQHSSLDVPFSATAPAA
jgi:hypothetical protein